MCRYRWRTGASPGLADWGGAVMGKQRRIPSNAPRLIGMALALLSLLLAGCEETRYGNPHARTILSATDADRVAVQPGGRQVIFWPKGPSSSLMILDVSTEERVLISEDMSWGGWLDDEFLYGYDYAPTTTLRLAYYAINLRPVAVVRLETRVTAEALPERIQEADRIYAAKPETSGGYLLLLLQLDADRRVVGGYAVPSVRDLDTLLAGHPYKIAPPGFPSGSPGEKHFSPDGKYYYICDGVIVNPLRIYSQEGDLLDYAGVSASGMTLVCYGWAWDGSGVFIQQIGPGLRPRIGPLQLLEVQP